MRTKVGFAARLLDGEVPPDLEEVFADSRRAAVPGRMGRHSSQMQLPRLGEPVQAHRRRALRPGRQLDTDPWLALLLRGREREALLGALSARLSLLLADGRGGAVVAVRSRARSRGYQPSPTHRQGPGRNTRCSA